MGKYNLTGEYRFLTWLQGGDFVVGKDDFTI